MIVYVILFRPFADRIDFWTELFNECAVLAVTYASLGFADNITSAEGKKLHGWIVIAIIMIQIVVSLVLQLQDQVRKWIRKSKCCCCCKKEQVQKPA